MQYYGTLGPACGEMETLKLMFQAGMTGVRLNLSHGNLEQKGYWLDRLKEAAGREGIDPQILMDLQGPELRIGKLDREYPVEKDETILFGAQGIPVPDLFLEQVKEGDRFLLDDGKLEFAAVQCERPENGEGNKRPEDRVEKKSGNGKQAPEKRQDHSWKIHAKVLRGGIIKSGKSLAVVGKELPMPTLTGSDRENIRAAKQYGITGVMLPFVRNKGDLLTLKAALEEAGAADVKIFAKIENLQGVRSLTELIPYCDHVVIARGDLGNAMPLWKLPGIQKRIADVCQKAQMPFMVVTQMLDSMQERAVPTRAEVLDIYNAVLDGASSLMLTGETAIGKFPVESMKYLVRTGQEAEKDMREYR